MEYIVEMQTDSGLPADLDEKVGEKEDHNFGKSRRKVGVCRLAGVVFLHTHQR